MNSMEELCRPLILFMCQLREFRRQGLELEMELVVANIEAILSSIKLKCSEDLSLARDFSLMEKPLAFFIDYMIKESAFNFGQSWQEMGRGYGELSGDEKFFDMLSSSLDDPNAKDRIEIFFIMMGLGFRGVYKKEPEIIERKMKVCGTRMDVMLDINKEVVTPQSYSPGIEKEQESFFRSIKFILVLSIFFAICSLVFNYYIFDKNTKPFQKIIDRAEKEAIPYANFDNLSGIGGF